MRFDHYDSQTATPNIYYKTNNVTVAISADTDYDIVMDGNAKNFYLNGVVSSSTLNLTMNNATVTNFFLFTFGNNGASSGAAKSCRMYYFRVYNADGTLACALQPVRRKSDSVAGFLDTVSGRFVTALQGSLAAGEGFTSVKYVATSTGGGYIRTGYWPAPTNRVETKVRFMGDVSGTQSIFCSRKTHQYNNYSCLLDGGYMRFDHQNNNATHNIFHKTSSGNTAIASMTDYEIVMDGDTKKFSLNGVESTSSLLGTMGGAATDFWLFALPNNDEPLDGNYAKSCRMYYFKVYDTEGELRVSLIPMRRKSDGAAGFCDDVRGGFYTSPADALEAPRNGLVIVVH